MGETVKCCASACFVCSSTAKITIIRTETEFDINVVEEMVANECPKR